MPSRLYLAYSRSMPPSSTTSRTSPIASSSLRDVLRMPVGEAASLMLSRLIVILARRPQTGAMVARVIEAIVKDIEDESA